MPASGPKVGKNRLHLDLTSAAEDREAESNPQIGVQLYISRRTVETHLSHVFRKLDVSSRGQAAAVAASVRTPRADDNGADPSPAGPPGS